ncbi:carboxymuconolactone decarboxylase family protein [Anaeromyxobacter terrae]|uniref:carboxymuconolactone decarboxylase family protein n=1 Tax=Anaeromyxobacter terrae TaxID=2925406 RepID=UPI001F583E24|nr:carboxymuconolactone decarboxylase family protein [Anaeromyxobacter sp. SG22]
MSPLERLRDAIPDPARDVRLNLQAVLQGGALTEPQRWGVAVASAAAARNAALRDAVVAEARARGLDAAVDDGLAAASLMAMNNVYYRFRHMVGKPGYSERPARLRMGRLAQPATSRVELELFSLAASAINGCEACVRAHEDVVVKGGLGEDAVHDAVRIAAVIHAAAVALEIGEEGAVEERGESAA